MVDRQQAMAAEGVFAARDSQGYKIGGVRYRPFEMAFDQRAEGREAWQQRVRWALLRGAQMQEERAAQQAASARDAAPLAAPGSGRPVPPATEADSPAESALMARAMRAIGF